MFSFFEKLIRPFEEVAYVHHSKLLHFLLFQVQGIKKYILLVALFSTIAAATEVYIFQFLGELVDSLKEQEDYDLTDENMYELLKISLVLLIFLPLSVFLRTLLEYQALEVNFPVRVLFNFHAFILKQNIDFFQQEPAGKIANTLTQTAFATRLILVKLVNTFTFLFVFFVSMGVLLTGIDLLLLIPVIVWVLGYIFIIMYFFPRVKSQLERQAGAMSEMVGKLVDTYNNVITVKIFSNHKSELKYATSHMGEYMDAAQKHMRVASSVQFVMWTINVLLVFGTFALSIFLWGQGKMTVGAIAAAVAVSFRLYTMSHWIMWELLDVSRNIGVVHNGMKLVAPFLESIRNKNIESPQISEVEAVSFKNVSFAYDGKRNVISNVSFNIKKGERLGVIGSSGSGKSTLAKLLLKLREPDDGDIFIKGKNIKSMTHDVLLKNISAVTQDVQMLHRSIRENLLYGSEDISEAQMVAAAKAAGAHEFICNIVDEKGRHGYDAHVGVGGAKLSGGQKQRISLARALAKQADVYILDEATSALDLNTEARVLADIGTFLKGKTVIMITHREASLAWVDRLIKIEGGGLDDTSSRTEVFVPNEAI